MQKPIRKLLLIATLLVCSSAAFSQNERPTYKVTEISDDLTYGRSSDNPIKVGYGPAGERYYLNQLTGAKGGEIKYRRLGSCCGFVTDSPLAVVGGGMLDRYKIKGKGSKAVVIYLNMYDFDDPKGIAKYGIR